MANAVEPRITLEVLQSYYHLPLVEVAKELNVSLTMLKKICRKLNIQRWPHRQVRSIINSIEELKERHVNNLEEHADVQAQIKLLEKKKRLVSRGASSGLQAALRNVLFLASPEDIEEETVDDVLTNLQKVVPPPSRGVGKKGKIPLLKMVMGSTTNGQGGQPTKQKTSLSTLQAPVAFEPAYQSPAMANVRLQHHRQREREMQQQQQEQDYYDDHDHEANNYHHHHHQHQQQHDEDYEKPQPQQDHYAWQMLLKQQQQQQREHHQKQRQQHEQRQQQGGYPDSSMRFGNGRPADMSLIHDDRSRQQGAIGQAQGYGTVVKSEPTMVPHYRSLQPDEDEMGINVLQSAAVAAAAANNECLAPALLRTGRGFHPPRYHQMDDSAAPWAPDKAYAAEDAGWYYNNHHQHPHEPAVQQAHSAIHRQHLQMQSQLDGEYHHGGQEGRLGHGY